MMHWHPQKQNMIKLLQIIRLKIDQMKVSHREEMTLKVNASEFKTERMSSLEEEMRTRVESLVEEKVVLEKNLLFDH